MGFQKFPLCLLQADAQRLLIVGSTPPHHPFASSVPQHLVLPQSEQLSSLQQSMDMEEPCDFLNTTTGIANDVSNDVSDPGSLQGSDDEEEGVGADGVMSFVACHGAEPAMVGNAGDAASTLAEIFRCFICLGKVYTYYILLLFLLLFFRFQFVDLNFHFF